MKNWSFRCAFNVEALLFCFASVQIGARGAALMQTTVESAKLRMEQIAELAKTGVGWGQALVAVVSSTVVGC